MLKFLSYCGIITLKVVIRAIKCPDNEIMRIFWKANYDYY